MNKWIKCSDKLPDFGEHVIIFFDYMFEKIHIAKLTFNDGNIYDTYWLIVYAWENIEMDEVTHWMPLPEPPKE